MHLIGRVLRTERRSGNFTDRQSGEQRPYDYWLVRVLTDLDDVVEARIPGNRSDIAIPAKGEEVDLPVEASAPGGTLRITVTASSLSDSPWASELAPV